MTDKKYNIELKTVCKSYDDKLILDHINLAVREGEFCTVIGPSGCGKSTLLRLILGQEQASSGLVSVNGKPVERPGPERGIVYQKYSLFPNLTVLENATLGLRLRKSYIHQLRNKGEHDEEAMEYLTRAKLDKHANKYPYELSGGMRQRAAIIQALIMKPDILLMDEPFGALDPQTREDMQLFVLELWEQLGMTVFFVTHDLEEALYLGTRCFVLSQYYTDDREEVDWNRRGAKIVADHHLTNQVASSKIKESAEFIQLMQQIRQDGFDPAYLQHVEDFNLKHPDSHKVIVKD